LKRALIRLLPVLLLSLGLLSCGGSTPPPSEEPPTSGLAVRVFAVNDHPSIPVINIVNGETDTPVFNQIGLVARPQFMELTPDRRYTIVYHAGSNILIAADNNTEASVVSIALSDWTESVVAPADRIVYAAVRGIGAVSRWDVVSGEVSNIPVPTVRRLVKNPGGSLVLAFSDESDSVTVINTADSTTTAVAGFDRPVWAVFSSDGSKAYILSCGPECGGTAAGVTELNMNNLSLGAHIAVSAATMAILDGTSLYVAGSTAGGGVLDVVNVSNMTLVTAGVAISNGFHHRMALAGGRVFIGATACTNCLTMVSTSNHTAVVGGPNGPVTGLAPISNRNVIYVAEGSLLRVYDTSTGEFARQINLIGQIRDVRQIN
jgi:hypothetical protein